MTDDQMRAQRYDLRTLAHLEAHEVDDKAFAHLCKYAVRKEEKAEKPRTYDLYRICLQDNRILGAIERAHSFIRLESLMLYIAVHELVHVIRFASGQADFEAPRAERLQEEEKVDQITRTVLHPVADKDMGLVLDCFSSRYSLLESCG
ncbi:MAG TPA: hypothetical protein PLQ15_07565 [Syntrophales bacterium]|nr:hypothetical protein [Syntrophobacterales bacterium]HNS55036.1 hypothetical protein [Syntrophales bacterium]HQL90445.1 hypothetical protein [Syntrophales bacterium]